MAKKRKATKRASPASDSGRKTRVDAGTRRERPRDLSSAFAAVLLAAGFAGAALVFDVRAEASFDAPKRTVALFAVAAAALAALAALASARLARPSGLFAGGPLRGWSDRRIPLALIFFAGAAAAASALVSPRRELALDSLRATAILALLLPLGASSAVARRTPLLVFAFLAGTAVDAVVSILQAARLYQPFPLVTHGDREATGAFAGNVGYLALALALAAVVAAGLAMTPRRPWIRAAAALSVALFAVALVVNRNLTAFSALAVGVAVLAVGLFGRRAVLPLAGALVAGTLAVFLYAPMRARASEIRGAVRAGNWDAILSYRTGAWLAAARMARERPFAGFGPGTFGAEFVPHRLDAEIAAGRRLTTPLLTSSYGETHCDYLQPFAEEGFPAALAAIGAAALVAAATARRVARMPPGPGKTEAALLLGFLAAGATAALTWFPLQRPITALPLLFALGRAWRISEADGPAGSDGPPPAVGTGRAGIVGSLALGAVLAILLRPEIARYRAERDLRTATDSLRFVLTHPSEVPDSAAALERIALIAADASPALPGDPRPRLAEGSARLVRGDAALALAIYRGALRLGERAELDLNIGRAYERLGREDEARAAFVRAAWVSPALLGAMLPDVAGPAAAEVARLEAELAKGDLKAPPPLPEGSP